MKKKARGQIKPAVYSQATKGYSASQVNINFSGFTFPFPFSLGNIFKVENALEIKIPTVCLRRLTTLYIHKKNLMENHIGWNHPSGTGASSLNKSFPQRKIASYSLGFLSLPSHIFILLKGYDV